MATRDALKAELSIARRLLATAKKEGLKHLERRAADMVTALRRRLANPTEEKARQEREAVLAAARAAMASVDGRRAVEYQIAGYAQELEDGLKALEKADQADDHVAFYRHGFDRAVRQLRDELASDTPNIHEIALAAMQAAWLAHIWPILQTKRLGWRAPDNLKSTNTNKQTKAALQKQRCFEIERELPANKRTPAAIRNRYNEKWPGKAPALKTIRSYRATSQE